MKQLSQVEMHMVVGGTKVDKLVANINCDKAYEKFIKERDQVTISYTGRFIETAQIKGALDALFVASTVCSIELTKNTSI